ncbi:hypothetical protein N431DRAFT_81548 [Stipitochalara longipes BDJ]|nr:hypothetical protein N431DRAFT_81548 [Stipitochalara longipes BDJ]
MASAMIALRNREILEKILLRLVGDDKGITIITNTEDYEAPRRISVSRPSDSLRSVLNFAVVVNTYLVKEFIDFTVINEYLDEKIDAKNKIHNKRLGEWYRDYNNEHRPITRLPEELLNHVLDSLTIKPRKLLDTHKRASLSVDSFASTAASLDQDTTQIRQFRLVCHRFAGVGRGRLLLRVRIRFSSEGFHTLREISGNENFRGSVQQFSYMIPRFYPSDVTSLERKLEEARASVDDSKLKLALRVQGRRGPVDRQQPTYQELRTALRRGEADAEQLVIALRKAQQQKEIVEQKVDVKTLVYALTRFSNLQQLRLMKVVDADDKWDKYLRAHADVAAEFRPFEWKWAYEHAATTLAFAIQQSHSSIHRFSSRFMDPKTPILVTQGLKRTISSIAERVSVLEFEFRQTDIAVTLEQKMSQLSALFQVVFNAAIDSLRSLHIGFTRPVSIPLRDIFHDVHLARLEHIGLHMWQMNGDELLNLLKRHKKTLRSLRLRHVLLRRNLQSDCDWRQVLQFIRLEIRPTGYVSLRGIDYEDDIDAANGMHFVNIPAQNNTISDEDSDIDDLSDDAWSESSDGLEEAREEDEGSVTSASNTIMGEQNEDEQEELDESTDDSHESHDELDDNELTRAFRNIPIAESTPLLCECANGFGWDDLIDDGRVVTKEQWQKWQQWVVKYCPLHDPPIPLDS